MTSRREQTERAILKALEDQLCETGMAGVGVNVVARRAGVSKELIYRYFDGLPGLMLAWMQEQDFWTRKSNVVKTSEASRRAPSELILAMLREQIDALADNGALREVRRWELIERNEISARLADRRETAARSFIDRIDGLTDEADVPAMVSILLAGVLYLMLRAKTEAFFLGVPLRTEEGRERIWAALKHLMRALPEDLKAQSLDTLEGRRRPDRTKKNHAP
jgi:AcrR family transcriptional regulator